MLLILFHGGGDRDREVAGAAEAFCIGTGKELGSVAEACRRCGGEAACAVKGALCQEPPPE